MHICSVFILCLFMITPIISIYRSHPNDQYVKLAKSIANRFKDSQDISDLLDEDVTLTMCYREPWLKDEVVSINNGIFRPFILRQYHITEAHGTDKKITMWGDFRFQRVTRKYELYKAYFFRINAYLNDDDEWKLLEIEQEHCYYE